MTVKCLHVRDKVYIVNSFISGTITINDLADSFLRSRRTIIRVLEEYGVDPGVKRRISAATKAKMVEIILADLSSPIMKVEMIKPVPMWKRVGQALSKQLSNLGRSFF